MYKDYPDRSCDPAMISRFFDGELGTEESDKVRAHLDMCPSCRKALEGHRIVSENFLSAAAAERARVDFDFVEKRLLQRIRTRHVPWRNKLLDLIKVKKFYIPVTALAATLTLFFTFFSPTAPPTAPSALITSFTGDISSVMIFETPETRQTILWFNEDLPENGKNHVL